MLGACIDLELGQLRGGELVLREHAFHGLADHLGRAALELLAQRPRLEATGEAGVPVDHLLVELLPGHVDLLRVDDDDEVTRVDVRRVLRLPLAPQCVRDLGREPSEGLALGVDDVPVTLDLTRLGGIGLHHMKGRRSDDRTAGRSVAPARSSERTSQRATIGGKRHGELGQNRAERVAEAPPTRRT